MSESTICRACRHWMIRRFQHRDWHRAGQVYEHVAWECKWKLPRGHTDCLYWQAKEEK